MNILIAGANGTVGNQVVEQIVQRGDSAYALVHSEPDPSDFDAAVHVIQGDLEGDLTGQAENMDVVIFAAGSGANTGTDKTHAVDQEGAKSLIDEAKRAGVQRFIMLSSKGADDPSQAGEKMKPYLTAKHNADQYLKDSGLEYLILRPVRLTNDAAQGTVTASENVPADAEITRADVAACIVESVYNDQISEVTIELCAGDTPVSEALQNFALSLV